MNEDDQTYTYQGDLLARIDELPKEEAQRVTELLAEPEQNAEELQAILKPEDEVIDLLAIGEQRLSDAEKMWGNHE